MLVGRLFRRLNSLGLSSFSEYYRHVVYTGEREMVQLLDAICTNETWFFRNPDHFTFIRDQLVPAWGADVRASRRQPRLRVWSAACSSGEEPYSLAMVLLEALPGWEVNILATDLSSRALARARAATWPIDKSQDIPPRYLSQYMLRGTRSQQGKMRAGAELRKAVVFDRAEPEPRDVAHPASGAVRPAVLQERAHVPRPGRPRTGDRTPGGSTVPSRPPVPR
jgi:chemotaxis protein methyltransferase CheR